MKLKSILLILFLLIFSGYNSAQHWQQVVTSEDACKVYPDKMKYIFENLNLDYKGLENVKMAYRNNDLPKACELLLGYYKSCINASHLRVTQPEKTTKTDALSDTVLNNVFVIQNVRGVVPWGADGHRDWYYKGLNNDKEWAWLSNRHSQINDVFTAYLETGNPKYAIYIDEFLRDFIIKSMPYPAEKSSSSVWRGLEVAARAKVWSRIFYGMLNSEFLSPSTRLLMLCSLADHAHYNRNFHAGNNWLTMEISALATVATNFPEYKMSDEWLTYSIQAMSESMKGQVYDDGVQTELTSHYHNVSLHNFELFKDICERAGRKLPAFFNETIEKMYSYIAHAVRPDGKRNLNNDGDQGSDRELILEGATKYNRPDWKFIATNGTSGVRPTDGPSYFYPWAGQLISRSGFESNAHWSFFDMGPWGSGHQHSDKMHLSVFANGRDLLVDCGRFAYTGEVATKFRKYSTGSQSHNVLLIDGNGQAPGPNVTEEPVSIKDYLIKPDYDLGRASFSEFAGLEGVCKHTRTLFYSRSDLWVVVDEVSTDRPRNIEALWHWHPENLIQIENGRAFTQNEKGNLQIVPAGSQNWEVKMVKGQEQPEIQGWYSKEYNIFEPNPTTIYSTKIESNSTFVWVLYPSEKVEKPVKVEIVSRSPKLIKVKITNEKDDKWLVDVPLE